jgi:hypothetical protein
MSRSGIVYRFLDWPLHVHALSVSERQETKRTADIAALVVSIVCTAITLQLSESPLLISLVSFFSATIGFYIGRCIMIFGLYSGRST